MSVSVAVAARWLTDDLPPIPDPALDKPTIVRDVWVGHYEGDPTPATVYRLHGGAIPDPVEIKPDAKGRYRVTVAPGVRRRLTLDELRGVA